VKEPGTRKKGGRGDVDRKMKRTEKKNTVKMTRQQ
jgi:hypothetical protein